MKQYTHTNNKGTWKLWQQTVRLASGATVTVQYFLPAGKKPRTKEAQAATAIEPGHEIHEIGERKTPVVSRKVTKPESSETVKELIDSLS